MGRTSRTVARLHLRAASRSAVRRALPLIEDAFRTATLPDAGARLVFVRRLNLGRLPETASAQTLSLLLESRFTQADWRLVPARDADGRDARAVWFRDALEVHELAALKIAGGRPLKEWFWPLAVPALATAASPADRIRAIAFSLAAQEEAAAALPAWVTTLVRAGHREQLIAALHPGDGRTLLCAAGVYELPAMSHVDPNAAPVNRRIGNKRVGEAPRQPGVRARQSGPAVADDRIEFVDRMLGLSCDPSIAASRSPAGIERVVVRRNDAREQPVRPHAHRRYLDRRKPSWPTATNQSAVRSAPAEPHSNVFRQDSQRRRTSARVSARAHRPGAPRIDGNDGDRSRAEGVLATPSPWALPGTVATAAGGLLFLIRVLDCIGFADGRAKADAGSLRVLAQQILGLLVARLRIPHDDPAYQLVASTDWLSPEGGSYESGTPATIVASTFSRELDAPNLWLSACRRFLRRQARLGPATLVLRPARLAITDTHVDVFFPLSAADIRIRRAGLDIDPGWVPWFARVIGFHYQEGPWL